MHHRPTQPDAGGGIQFVIRIIGRALAGGVVAEDPLGIADHNGFRVGVLAAPDARRVADRIGTKVELEAICLPVGEVVHRCGVPWRVPDGAVFGDIDRELTAVAGHAVECPVIVHVVAAALHLVPQAVVVHHHVGVGAGVTGDVAGGGAVECQPAEVFTTDFRVVAAVAVEEAPAGILGQGEPFAGHSHLLAIVAAETGQGLNGVGWSASHRRACSSRRSNRKDPGFQTAGREGLATRWCGHQRS